MVVSTKTALSGCPQGQRTGMYLGAFGCLIPNVCSQIKLFFGGKFQKSMSPCEILENQGSSFSEILCLVPYPHVTCNFGWVLFVWKTTKPIQRDSLNYLVRTTQGEILLSTEHENEMLISVCFCWPITCWTSSTGNFSFEKSNTRTNFYFVCFTLKD